MFIIWSQRTITVTEPALPFDEVAVRIADGLIVRVGALEAAVKGGGLQTTTRR